MDVLGGGNLKILMFYGTPGFIHSGQTVQFCYGVASAKTVKIEPFIDDVWPPMTRCMVGKPKTATDAQGHSQSQSSTITVK